MLQSHLGKLDKPLGKLNHSGELRNHSGKLRDRVGGHIDEPASGVGNTRKPAELTGGW